MHHAAMLLRRANIAGVLESDPRMTGFEQHREHFAPHVNGLQLARRLDLAALGAGFVSGVGLFELDAVLVVQVRHVGWREQRPAAFFHDAAHEQVRNPVGGVHVVRAAAVVAGVFTQLKEFFNVQVPGFQVGAYGAFAFAALVDCDSRVVNHFEERHHALRLAVGALNMSAQGAHRGPIVAQAAGKLRQQCVFFDGVVNAAQVIGDRGQVARRQLRAQSACVKKGGRA